MSEPLPFVAEPPGSAAQVTTAASNAAARWGLPEPVLLRLGMSGLFTTAEEVVLRVCRPTAEPDAALWLARLLDDHGIRVPRHVREPVVIEGLTVFAIERLTKAGAVDWEQVGDMVRRVHAIDPSIVEGRYPAPWCASFPHWQLDDLFRDVAPDLSTSARSAIGVVVERWRDVPSRLRTEREVLCHGDVHPGNVMQTADGAVLLDWDLLCRGPIAWDHAPLMTWTERWGGASGIYEQFATGYGRSYRDDDMGEMLAELRLLIATLMRVRAGRTDAAAAREADRRLRYWNCDIDAPQWQPM